MARVLLKNLNKKYDDVHAVKDVNLEIHDREFVVLVGPSGCGKTTTLRMVAGLEEISSGEIRIDEQRINELAPMDRDIAMVFQNYALYPHMSVYDNMAFGLRMRKFATEEIERRVRQAAEILGIQALLERRPRQLSGGQRQRVALGRAIVRNPRVFLFDEPLSNLAAGLRLKTPTKKGGALQRYAGRPVVLGVRPEALRVASGGDPAEYAFDPAVEVVEPLGNEILLDVRAGAHAMVARVDPATRVKVHEKVRLAFDPERLHFFDPGSEAAI